MKLVVRAVTPLTAEIRHFELAAPDGAALPAYTPGAHLSVHVVLPDGTPARREYSLLGDGSATASYEIAVQCREPAAGSAWMHRLAPATGSRPRRPSMPSRWRPTPPSTC
nr:hypothetical protein [Bordetella pertussis]